MSTKETACRLMAEQADSGNLIAALSDFTLSPSQGDLHCRCDNANILGAPLSREKQSLRRNRPELRIECKDTQYVQRQLFHVTPLFSVMDERAGDTYCNGTPRIYYTVWYQWPGTASILRMQGEGYHLWVWRMGSRHDTFLAEYLPRKTGFPG